MGNSNEVSNLNVAFQVPLWKKYALTFNEAAKITNIGEHTLRALAQNDTSFVLRVGTKTLLKQKQLLEFLDGINQL